MAVKIQIFIFNARPLPTMWDNVMIVDDLWKCSFRENIDAAHMLSLLEIHWKHFVWENTPSDALSDVRDKLIFAWNFMDH